MLLNGGITIENLLKPLLAAVLGAPISVFIIALWKNKEVDWDFFIASTIGGLIGVTIALGIKKIIAESKKI